MRVLALDVGTSSVKAAVLEAPAGTISGPIERVGYELHSPSPDAHEIDPHELWQAVTGAARAAMRRQDAVAAIGLSVLTPALVLLDAHDEPVAPLWIHLDRRARPVARRVLEEVGDEFLHTVGNRPLPGGLSALCFRQLVNDQPVLASRIKSYLHVNGWLALRMTGARAFDPANASFTGLFGTLTDQNWSPRWCDYFGVDRRWLPPVVCGSTTMGQMRADVAAEFGVGANIPVKLGTADTSSAMLAASMVPGDLLHSVGTTQVLAVFARQPTPSPKRLTRLLGVGDAFIHVTHNPVGGVALDWMRDLCFREQTAEQYFTESIAKASARDTRVQLDPPFLGGDRLEIEAKRAAFRELDLTSDRLDLLAAVLQAMVQRHREALLNLGQGNDFERIFLTGGGAEVVRKLIPEYTTANIHEIEEGSLRGVARLFA